MHILRILLLGTLFFIIVIGRLGGVVQRVGEKNRTGGKSGADMRSTYVCEALGR